MIYRAPRLGYTAPMRVRYLSLLPLLAAASTQAALISTHTDADLASPVLDGIISPNEYGPANTFAYTGGGTGFGSNQLGRATMYLKSDVTNLFVAFDNIAINTDSNQTLVYVHTRSGGYQTSGEMNDFTDQGRRNASILSVSGTESMTFENAGTSNKADFALCFNNRLVASGGFSALFDLRGTGFTHGIVPHLRSAIGSSNLEFRLPRAALGLAISGTVDVATFMVSGTGYMADGGHPRNTTNEIGFGVGQLNTFRDFHRFAVTDISPPSGLTQRVANTTLQMPQILPTDGPYAYTTTNAFPGLVFTLPMAIAIPPGETNRLFVAERAGVISVITNLAAPTRSVFMDISSRVDSNPLTERGLLSLAFHPNFASNGYVYVWYMTAGDFRDRLSRFTVSASNASQGDTNSEQVIFSQVDDASNHNGGDIHFGSDGYLYASLGDEGNANDSLNNSQRIDKDFFAGLLRIDVDKKPGNLQPNHHAAIAVPTNYFVPADNPFIGATSFNGSAVSPSAVRTEFYAVGLRNPFRWSFDSVSGKLYLGDVGQDNREEVDLIKKGGNYGWKWREGKIATPTVGGSPPAGFTNAIDPLLDYARGTATNQGNTVIGGRVYWGNRFTELVGRYIFCDYGSGHIWSMTDDGTNATSFNWLSTDNNLVYVGADPRDGELLFCDLPANQIKRLTYTSVSTNGLPATLADTGAFVDLQSLTPYPGVVPYELNVPFWSDGAIKTRWFSVPATNQTIGFNAELPWTFPTGTVWIKHFELQLTNGVPASARRIETRLLVKNADGSGGYGVTYRWGNSTTNAVLVPANGLAQDDAFIVNDGGTIRTQAWHYPTRAECLQCHQPGAGFALGFNTAQLNRDHNYNGITTNQLRALNACGYFSASVSNFNLLRKLAPPTDTAHSLDYRARSYLEANCRQCHFPGGPTPAAWDARIATTLPDANIVNGILNNTLGNPGNRVVVPGLLTNSMLHTRIAMRGVRQMPPLGSSVVDTQGVALIAAWISTTLTNYQTFAAWQTQHFGSTTNIDAGENADPDGDGNANRLEFLTDTDPTNVIVDDAWALDFRVTNGTAEVLYPRVANRGFDVQMSTNLLDGAWQSLDVPENSPFYSSTPATAIIPDPASSNRTESFYRIRIYEP